MSDIFIDVILVALAAYCSGAKTIYALFLSDIIIAIKIEYVAIVRVYQM